MNVYSDASTSSFPENRAGDYKVLLANEIDLKNIEYNVAVSSVSRYYETFEKNVVFVREKRDVPVIANPVTVHNTYPATSSYYKKEIKKRYDNYIKNGDPIYVLTPDNEKLEIEMLVDGAKKKTYVIYPNTIHKSMFEKETTFDAFEGVQFKLKEMLLQTAYAEVLCLDDKAHTVQLTFNKTAKEKLGIVQFGFSTTLSHIIKDQRIGLRTPSWKPLWVDLRTTLPYYVQFSDNDDYQPILRLFDKVKGKLSDYLYPPFYGNTKSVSVAADPRHPYWKLHADIAKLFQLPEEIVAQSQFIDTYFTQNSNESLIKSYAIGEIYTADQLEMILAYIQEDIALPYKMTCKRTGDTFDVTITEGLRIVLPHAFNSFTLAYTTSLGEWPCSISYVNDHRVGHTKKSFAVHVKKSFAEQVNALQEATKKALKEITQELLKEAKDGTEPSEEEIVAAMPPFRIRRHANQQMIGGIDMPEGYDLQLHGGLATSLKLKRENFSGMSDYVWILCDIVGDTIAGEIALPLLTPTPIKMSNSASVLNREYVNVVSNTFQTLHIRMITSLKTLVAYDGPNNVLVVLHFKPKHKRSGYKEEKEESKRLRLDDGRSSRLL